jgi:hypothetical protein
MLSSYGKVYRYELEPVYNNKQAYCLRKKYLEIKKEAGPCAQLCKLCVWFERTNCIGC